MILWWSLLFLAIIMITWRNYRSRLRRQSTAVSRCYKAQGWRSDCRRRLLPQTQMLCLLLFSQLFATHARTISLIMYSNYSSKTSVQLIHLILIGPPAIIRSIIDKKKKKTYFQCKNDENKIFWSQSERESRRRCSDKPQKKIPDIV